MKKVAKWLCIFMVLLMLTGCKAGMYMEDFENVQWTCSEIQLQFSYKDVDSGPAVGTLGTDNQTVDIVCRYALTKTIWIFDKTEYESITDDEVCEPLFIGSYSIEDDVATVKITTDNLFNGEYLDKEIHLTKTPIK